MAKEDPNKKFMKKMLEIRKKLLNKKTMEDIGEKASDMVRERTRLGYGIKEPGSDKQKKLTALSRGYKNQRKRNPPTGPSTPAKSNLTYTGKMLDDIDYKVKGEDKDGRSIEIGIYDEESAEKAEWVTTNDPKRAFMGLTKAQIKELKVWMGKNYKKLIKKK